MEEKINEIVSELKDMIRGEITYSYDFELDRYTFTINNILFKASYSLPQELIKKYPSHVCVNQIAQCYAAKVTVLFFKNSLGRIVPIDNGED